MRCLSSRGFGCPPQAAASAKLLPILSYRIDLEADLPDSAHLHFYRRSLFRPRIARPYESHKDMSQAAASAKLLPTLSYRTDLEADLPDSAHLHFYRRSLFRPRIARPYESHEAIQKTGVWHKCHSLFSARSLAYAFRSAPSQGTEIVGTRLNQMRQALNAVYRVLSRKSIFML